MNASRFGKRRRKPDSNEFPAEASVESNPGSVDETGALFRVPLRDASALPSRPIDLDTPDAIVRFEQTEKALERQARREAREENADAHNELIRAKGELTLASASRINGQAHVLEAKAKLIEFDRTERAWLLAINIAFAILLMLGALFDTHLLKGTVVAAAALNSLMAGIRYLRSRKVENQE